ncbi:uncharacterized protein CEXT_523391 [Caerostris extrusa]|uniref:Uncharacterized protein n=1 Tax=Caerostris extrusa TaxID=172846 RepID=A0AAV4Y7B8_CAEEX|nr:uncharacterized protein CEXT_523391 [Caerostris extrusa]
MVRWRVVCGEVWAHNGRIEESGKASNAQFYSLGFIPSLAPSKETWGARGPFHWALGGLSALPSATHLKDSFTEDKYVAMKKPEGLHQIHSCNSRRLLLYTTLLSSML